MLPESLEIDIYNSYSSQLISIVLHVDTSWKFFHFLLFLLSLLFARLELFLLLVMLHMDEVSAKFGEEK